MAKWPTSKQLVKRAIQEVGDGTPTGLANVLRLGANGYQKVYRWERGAKLPYDETMKILDKLGWLNMNGAASGEQDPAVPADPLAELAATGATVLRMQEAILDALGVDRDALELPEHPAEQSQARSTETQR